MTKIGSDADAAVLHSLRLKGRAQPAAIAAATGLDPAAVTDALAAAEEAGLVVQRTGRLSGWALSPAGREAADARIATERTEVDASALAGVYDRDFLPLNQDLKGVCTGFQLDPADRDGMVAGLTGVQERAEVVLAGMSGPLPRLGAYEGRLRAAYDRVLGGQTSALAQPMTDSYHDVWLELHEDLLQVLDREREED